MAGFSPNADERVTNKIHQLVGEGVQNVRQMAQRIRIYVKTDCFMILQYHHLQTADLILHLKMLEIYV